MCQGLVVIGRVRVDELCEVRPRAAPCIPREYKVLDRVYLFVRSYSLSCFNWEGPMKINTGSMSPEIRE
jgi:hypothetical protein